MPSYALGVNPAPPPIRPAVAADAPRIAAIYNEGIRERIATFETRERAAADLVPWLEDTRYPFLVAERKGEVVGWVAASQYRPRACYAGVAEFSVYVARDRRGTGVGRTLMDAFLTACAAAGFWKLLSRVFPENRGSRALLAACGFREVGVYENHARLDGAWRDVVIVERLLTQNVETPDADVNGADVIGKDVVGDEAFGAAVDAVLEARADLLRSLTT